MNRVVEFMKGSTDFLRTLGEMSALADEGDRKPVIIQRHEFKTMVANVELFYDMTSHMFLKFQEEITLHRLTSINEHAKLIVLDRELRNIYNELFRHKSKMSPELMTAFINHLKKTAVPTAEELSKDVILKTPNSNGQETKSV